MAEVLEHILPVKHRLTDMSNVKVSSPADGQVLKYVAADKKWENQALMLAALADVLISSPADGHVLTYVGADAKWENKAPTGGGGAITYQTVQGTTDVNTTSTSMVDMPDMTLTVALAGTYLIVFSQASAIENLTVTQYNASAIFQLLKDSSVLKKTRTFLNMNVGYIAWLGVACNFVTVASLTAGQIVKVQWCNELASQDLHNRPASKNEHRSLTIIKLA
jgi:hypothetical protein